MSLDRTVLFSTPHIRGVENFIVPNFQFTKLFVYIQKLQFNNLLSNNLYILLATIFIQALLNCTQQQMQLLQVLR
jgi:hypothetical protein